MKLRYAIPLALSVPLVMFILFVVGTELTGSTFLAVIIVIMGTKLYVGLVFAACGKQPPDMEIPGPLHRRY